MRLALAEMTWAILLALALSQCGCRSVHSCTPRGLLQAQSHDLSGGETSLELAKSAFERGCALEEKENPSCVEAYYVSAHWAWRSLEEDTAGATFSNVERCYADALRHLIFAAQRFGRLDPGRGLMICSEGNCGTVPVVHLGFSWEASDFQRLTQPPTGHESLLTRRYGCAGWGVPLVVERRRCDNDPLEARFYPEKSFFGATAILRFDDPSPVLEFHNPLVARSIDANTHRLPLAMDLSASLARTLEEAPRSYFAGFIEPGGAATSARLTFLEPYQPGKVPVVLIHGLFSDPQSWADLMNDLRATPGFSERFQLWVFRYPTGQGFLQSAAALRAQMQAALCELDPSRDDPALRQIVLIGHSMGGLIAKLQVTQSGELIWNRLANRALEEIVTLESTRAKLSEICYFDPSPDVARVIFIASPHCGSLCSSEWFGRGVAHFVEPSPQQAAMHEQLVRDNPGVFNSSFDRRLPTSIDMLASESPLLAAMKQMPLKPGVKLHNILGVSNPLSLEGPSDGIVSANSASHPGCLSVLAVGSPHAKVHRTLEASSEILRILHCHAEHEALSRESPAPTRGPQEFSAPR